MKPQQTYVVLASRGSGWEIHGPLAQEFRTLKEAEAVARELSKRYPQQSIGVYELRFLFGMQQRVVKQKIEAPSQVVAKRRTETDAPEAEPVDAENVVHLRTTS